MALLVGQRLGQYEITGTVGKGGMATVYRARQSSMDRDVAIKVIKPDLAEITDFVKRFEREAKTLASLSHAHILKVFDYGQHDDIVYLVMELLTGGNLSQLIAQGLLPLAQTARLLDQIASALDYAHGRGIIHRDLKPQNVLLDDGGNALLTDFGLAKLLNETSALTHSGSVMGTPLYMAPEQWQGEMIDARADIYALGVMLYEMVTGFVPFNGATPYRIMHMHIFETQPSLLLLKPELPPSLDAVLKVALAKNPEQRFAAAGELAKMFRAALAGADIEETLTSTSRFSFPMQSATTEAAIASPVLPNPPVTVNPVALSGKTRKYWQALRVGLLMLLILVVGGLGFLGIKVQSIAGLPSASQLAQRSTATTKPSSKATSTATLTPTRTMTAAPTHNITQEAATQTMIANQTQVGSLPKFGARAWVKVAGELKLADKPDAAALRSSSLNLPADSLARIIDGIKVGPDAKARPVYWYHIYIVSNTVTDAGKYAGWLEESLLKPTGAPPDPQVAFALQTSIARVSPPVTAMIPTPASEPVYHVGDVVILNGFLRFSPVLNEHNLVNVGPLGRYKVKAFQAANVENQPTWWYLLAQENDINQALGWTIEHSLSALPKTPTPTLTLTSTPAK